MCCSSLDTVRKFRAEVIQRSSINTFEALQKPEKNLDNRKTEFPQHISPRDRRPRSQRHKTLPVTAAELGAIPEGQTSEAMNSLKKKFENFGAGRDSKADSGILSGSEIDHVEIESMRSFSMEENIGEDDPVKLSVSAKASLFHNKIEESVRTEKKSSASGAKRYIDRKKRERSRTLPITEDEVKLAAEIADEENAEAEKKAEQESVSASTEIATATEQAEGEADELSR